MNNKAGEHGCSINTSGALDENDTHEVDRNETAQSLDQAITQIDIALKEADHSVVELIGAMTSMTCCVQRIDEKLTELRQYPEMENMAGDIEKNCKQAEADMQQAVKAFQFYDRMSQRFMHIYDNLHAVSDVIKAPDQQHPALWQKLRDNVRSVYSSEQQQHIQQPSINKVTDKNAGSAIQESVGDIELF